MINPIDCVHKPKSINKVVTTDADMSGGILHWYYNDHHCDRLTIHYYHFRHGPVRLQFFGRKRRPILEIARNGSDSYSNCMHCVREQHLAGVRSSCATLFGYAAGTEFKLGMPWIMCGNKNAYFIAFLGLVLGKWRTYICCKSFFFYKQNHTISNILRFQNYSNKYSQIHIHIYASYCTHRWL